LGGIYRRLTESSNNVRLVTVKSLRSFYKLSMPLLSIFTDSKRGITTRGKIMHGAPHPPTACYLYWVLKERMSAALKSSWQKLTFSLLWRCRITRQLAWTPRREEGRKTQYC